MKRKTLAQILVAHNQKQPKKKRQAKEKRVLRPLKGKHSDNPVYLSGTYTEYLIKKDRYGYHYIVPYGGGKIHKDIGGKWSKYQECERALIQWLEKTDKRAQSRYPGCPERKQTNYTLTFLEG